ncbi:MAG: DUF4340 domain-containing protein [Deltaproteobacteria bacterium]|nr:DUF4340 domain-containing protein [Deltaproteobacteria bacterium]
MKRIGRTAIGATIVVLLAGALAWKAIADLDADRRHHEDMKKRERLFTGWGSAHVKSFDLTVGGTSFRFVKTSSLAAQGFWLIERPIKWPADQNNVGAAIDSMVSVASTSVVAEAVTAAVRAQYGLDHPQVIAKVFLEDGTTHELRVGARNQSEECFWVSVEQEDAIHCARANFYEPLSLDLYAYRDKRIILWPKDAITSVTVDKGGKLAFGLDRTGNKWLVRGPGQVPRPADFLIVDSFLRILTKDLKAESFATDAIEKDPPEVTKRFGLNPPAYALAVKQTLGVEVRAAVGLAAGDGREPRGPFLQLEGTSFVAEVYDAFPSDLDKSFADFRDRTISRFDIDEVHRLDLWLLSGQKIRIERDIAAANAKESTWRMLEPTNRSAKPWKVQAVLTYFSTLRSSRVVIDGATPDQLASWKLAPPERRATFYNQKGDRLADVWFGKPIDSGHVYVSSAGLGRVDGIQDSTLAKVLPTRLDELVDDEKR